MALLPILTYPNPSLKEKSEPVLEVNDEIRELVANMFETMGVSSGIGLAAPQVGVNLTLFVMDVATQDPIDPEKQNPNPRCLINPKIVKEEGTIEFEEACLSCPELFVTVQRAENIEIEALNEKGETVTHSLSDLESICAQHEMDHLNGILLTDHISRLKRELYRKQMMRRKKEEDV